MIVENMNDTPYLKSKMLGPEVTATMTAVSSVVRSIFPKEKPIGIQILAGCNCEALAVAKGKQYFLDLVCLMLSNRIPIISFI